MSTDCPTCGHSMEDGSIKVYGGRLTWARVVWAEATDRPLSGRDVTLFRPGFLGTRGRPALLCPNCETVVVPPNASASSS